jgi:methionine-rich copper-binding protein CopC
MPVKVNLQFTDDIIADAGGNVITLTGPTGKRIDSGATSVFGNQLTVAIKKSTVLGKYTVRYRVISEDGHPITGTYKFSLAKKK